MEGMDGLMKIFFVAAIILASTSVVFGQTSHAGDLIADCNSSKGSPKFDYCNAFINGFANGILIDQIATRGNDPICLPDYTNTDELRGVIKAYGATHSDALNALSAPFAARALMQAYPCKK
jgi:hypothetical protein